MELEVAPPTATLPVTVCVTPTWPRLPAAQTLLVTNRVPFEERDLTDPHVVQEAQQLTGIRVLRSPSGAMRSTTARSYLNVPLWSAPWASDAHGSPLCAAALAGFEPRPVRVHCDRWWPRVRCVTLSGMPRSIGLRQTIRTAHQMRSSQILRLCAKRRRPPSFAPIDLDQRRVAVPKYRVQRMRSALRNLSAFMALLTLVTGLLLVSALGANAHPLMPAATNMVAAIQAERPAADHGLAACVSPSCQSDHSSGCCHMAGAGCSAAHAMCAASATFVVPGRDASPAAPRSAPSLSGLTPSVAQRPPATLA